MAHQGHMDSGSTSEIISSGDIPWSDEENEKTSIERFEPYTDRADDDGLLPTKAETTTETLELTIGSDGTHTPGDFNKEPSPNLIDAEDHAEATGELRSILSQQLPPTPSASSTRSRRQSYSFSKKPTPEPDLPFDFNRFQEQLRAPSAAPVAKYMKSFLHEFSKRQWNNTEQQKIVHDFLEFIRGKMLVYEPFKSASEAEFDNAHEGMEKLILNRLYPELFPPLIVVKYGKTITQKNGHGEDLDRDKILNNKIKIYSWVREEHLDIPDGPMNERFLGLAGIELNKLDQFRAPRDKIICILNCCKVLFGLLRHVGSDESADKFVPFLILTLLRANVANLCSHVSFIQNFRNPDKMTGEAGYYLSSLQGAMNFVEIMDRQSLTITDEAYEEMVEDSVKRIKLEDSIVPPSPATPVAPTLSRAGIQLPSKDLVFEKATGLLNIAKPSLSAVGRLFSHEGTSDEDNVSDQEVRHSLRLPSRESRLGRPSFSNTQSRSYVEPRAHGSLDPSNYDENDRPKQKKRPVRNTSQPGSFQASAGNFAGSLSSSLGINSRDFFPSRSSGTAAPASARVEITEEEALQAKAKERAETLATLCAMFENVEIGVIEMVLDEKRGKVGASIDALLEIGGS